MQPDTQPKSLLSKLLWLLGMVSFLASTFYPTDLAGYASREGISRAPEIAHFTERYVRYINPVLQVGLPLLLRDKAGMVELVKVSIATTLATHVLKHALNNVHVMGTRLGERPNPYPGKPPRNFADSNFNMPSGHSSMASCGAYFVSRRYGWKWALILFSILLLTMFARVSLDKHTLSAVISGALLRILMAAIFTTPYRKPAPPPAKLPETGVDRTSLAAPRRWRVNRFKCRPLRDHRQLPGLTVSEALSV